MDSRYEYIVNLSRDFITLIDRDYRYEIVNDAYCSTIGKERAEILNKTVAEVWGEEKFDEVIKPQIDRCFEGEEVQYIDTFAFGTERKHMHVSFFPYTESENKITHVLVYSHDITVLNETESRLAEYEYRDPLTGLFNRRSMGEILKKEIHAARRNESGSLMSVLFVSLKNFKKVNQTHGHHIGDLLLENTAVRIRDCLREGDYVFRFEGSILTVLLTNISHNTDAGLVAQKIYDAVLVPYRYASLDINISCRIGIAVFPNDGEDADTLTQNANSASVEADELSEPFLYYDKALHERSSKRMKLYTELRHAFEADELEMFYQPIVEFSSQGARVVGAEALVRWNHPERGQIGPIEFIELAEDTGVIASIDKWALYQVCGRLAAWSAQHDIYLCMNISLRGFLDEYLVDVVDSAVQSAGAVIRERLKLELTESRCMKDPEFAVRRINDLQQVGVEVWIDDFGTGQSSLGYLKQLPARTLKLDKTFIEDLSDDNGEREYLSGIITSIRARGKKVIIEGVTTKSQVDVLSSMGCTTLQGFYFGKPVSAADFHRLLGRSA